MGTNGLKLQSLFINSLSLPSVSGSVTFIMHCRRGGGGGGMERGYGGGMRERD